MVKRCTLSLIALLLTSLSMAEVVVLQNGQRIRGEIVLQNEEVLIIRSNNGMRYQYPINQVSSILEDTDNAIAAEVSNTTARKKTVTLGAQATAGAAYVPQLGWGVHTGADLMIGANIAKRKIFVGGEVGYRAKIINEVAYSFIPLQLCVSSTLGNQRSAPFVGMNIGYGFSTDHHTKGGICVGAEVGWHYEIDTNTSLVLSLNAEWQQAQTDVNQTIIYPESNERKDYTNHMGVNFLTFGAKIAIYF